MHPKRMGLEYVKEIILVSKLSKQGATEYLCNLFFYLHNLIFNLANT